MIVAERPAPPLRSPGQTVRPYLPITRALLAGLGALLVTVSALSTAGVLTMFDPIAQDLGARLQSPSLRYPLGTDHLGRDVLSRLVLGAGPTIGLAVAGVGLAGLIGAAVGLVGALPRGGPFRRVIGLLLQAQLAFPGHWLAVFFLAMLGNGTPVVILSLVVAMWVQFAWVALDEAGEIGRREFVQATRALGASEVRVLLRHVAPHLATPLWAIALIELQVAVSLVATLSFLGLGVRPPDPSWGGMVEEGRRFFPEAWWILTVPAAALAGTTLLVAAIGAPGRARFGRGRATRVPHGRERSPYDQLAGG